MRAHIGTATLFCFGMTVACADADCDTEETDGSRDTGGGEEPDDREDPADGEETGGDEDPGDEDPGDEDPDDEDPDDEDPDEDAPELGRLSGFAGLVVEEADCQLLWSMIGDPCPDCTLGWEVYLSRQSLSTCSFGDDVSGVFEIRNGAAYFNNAYWGTAEVDGGDITWTTAGYLDGAGYSYYYIGWAEY